jgi:hypothetical protein
MRRGEEKRKVNKKGGTHVWRGGWRASGNGGLDKRFGGV